MRHVTELRQVVKEMVADYGLDVTYRRYYGDGSYDPATGTNLQTPVDISARAILMDLSLQSNGLQVKPGTVIQAGDKVAYLQIPDGMLDTLQPENYFVGDGADDVLIVGDISYKIMTMKVVDTSGMGSYHAIMYELYLRR